MEAIIQSRYVWFSHGHPDHLNGDSLDLFRGKKILLPNHVGSRIKNWLTTEGFDVALTGYGDADMINFYEEDGTFIQPPCAKKFPVGPMVARKTESWGARYFVCQTDLSFISETRVSGVYPL